MTRRGFWQAVLVSGAAAALVGGCATATPPPPGASPPGTSPPGAVELTAADDGSRLDMATGQQLRVVLDANPTTGYAWAIDGELPPQLEQVGEAEFGRSSDAIGAGGTEVWTFEAVEPGEGRLALKYWRSFEPDVVPVETFQVDVAVR
jgi:inhibitor of cysteine peptidase